jgi:phage-related protein
MAVYKIKIPVRGYDGTNPTSATEIAVDRNSTRQVKQRILTAQFGDGYSQRVKNGINPTDETFNVKFSNRSREEVNNLAAFLNRQAGKHFELVITEYDDTDVTIKVLSEQYNINYTNTEIHTLTTTLKRVYEP